MSSGEGRGARFFEMALPPAHENRPRRKAGEPPDACAIPAKNRNKKMTTSTLHPPARFSCAARHYCCDDVGGCPGRQPRRSSACCALRNYQGLQCRRRAAPAGSLPPVVLPPVQVGSGMAFLSCYSGSDKGEPSRHSRMKRLDVALPDCQPAFQPNLLAAVLAHLRRSPQLEQQAREMAAWLLSWSLHCQALDDSRGVRP